MFPNDRRYTKEHEWVKVEGQSATVGITDFAQKELGDIVFVELPEIGRVVALGDVLGTIESVKAVSELYAPVSGTVAAVNTLLNDAPESVNRDAHEAGWICKLKLSKPGELDTLMDAAAYTETAS
jgi:glycine cleavage system H protein